MKSCDRLPPAAIEALAVRRWGKPVARTRRTLRLGRHGAVNVELEGDKAGVWYDFLEGIGGRFAPSVDRREQHFQKLAEAARRRREQDRGDDEHAKRRDIIIAAMIMWPAAELRATPLSLLIRNGDDVVKVHMTGPDVGLWRSRQTGWSGRIMPRRDILMTIRRGPRDTGTLRQRSLAVELASRWG